jgi:flagellar assembly protein FliH
MKMNSSSEPIQPTPYLPLEYREAGEPFQSPDPSTDPSPANSAAERHGASSTATGKPSGEAGQTAGDPAALLAARIEAERRAIRAEARQDAEREIQRARAAVAEAVEQFGHQREEYFRQAEEEVVHLALAITRRLIHRESQIDPHLLAGLVHFELEQLDAATSVRLIVSPDALGYWNDAAQSMSRSVEVAADKTLAPGDARIETALGSTVVSFERELKEIERGFFDLLSHRPPAAETKAVRVQ